MMRSMAPGIDVALLGQDRFQRPHAQLHLGEFRAVIVVVIVLVMVVVVVMMVIVVIVVVAGHGNLRRDVSALCDGPRKRMIQYPPGRRT